MSTNHKPWPSFAWLFPLLFFLQLAALPSWPDRPQTRTSLVPPAAGGFSRVQQSLREKVGQNIEVGRETARMGAGGAFVLAPDLVRIFYARRDYRPAWVGDKEISSQIGPLLQALKRVETEGLNPMDYHLAEIEAQLKMAEKALKKKRPLQPEDLADLDLLCSDAFLACAGHLAHGKADPETHAAAWQGPCIDESLAALLEDALMKGQVAEALESLPPQHPFYKNLKTALGTCRELARKTEWKPLPDGLDLKRGETGKEVKELGKRLFILGDFDRKQRMPGRDFDEVLEAAVLRFQGRHGLDISGSVDPPTLAALNVPLEERCRQLEANLERWRWLPRDLGERFIYVNVANFELEGFEGSRRSLDMKVVVGSEAWQTPDFTSQMTHLIINPDWTIPIAVILKETANYVLQNPCYFRDNKMVVLRKEEEGLVEIDPGLIDWTRLTKENLDFLIRQKPGPDNILGRLKFVFPNKYDIFLHDTPYQEDFGKSSRAYSHGCIRAEKPVELAVWVLRGKPGWDHKRILEAIEAGEKQTVRLAGPIDVFFLYNTAWVEDDGTIQFRADIYGRDNQVIEALDADPPSPFNPVPGSPVPD